MGSAEPGCTAASPAACSAPTLAGMAGTWTRVTGTLPPTLTSADINHVGQLELWPVSSAGVASSEGSPSALAETGDDWPLTDGGGSCGATTPATALDTITGDEAA